MQSMNGEAPLAIGATIVLVLVLIGLWNILKGIGRNLNPMSDQERLQNDATRMAANPLPASSGTGITFWKVVMFLIVMLALAGAAFLAYRGQYDLHP